jgi:hypothetical protein
VIGTISALVQADVRIRLRRLSSVVLFLILSATAYLWIPDPASGRALLKIDHGRALYNSAAIGMGTAVLGMLFIGLFGFYVISNSIERDIRSRCGFVIAATPVRSAEYLWGKFLGNVVFLVVFMLGFMISSMTMLLVRGEARLEPLVFVRQYALLLPQTIVFVSAVAILFESIPWLSGRLGDVLYFFLWSGCLGAMAPILQNANGPGVAGYFDFTGVGQLFDHFKRSLHMESISIGASPFDAHHAVVVYRGFDFDPQWIAPRAVALGVSLALVGVARVFFHRFDPARVRATEKASRNWLRLLDVAAKPFTRVMFVLWRPSGTSLLSAAWTDALMTITSKPLVLLVAIGVAVASIASAQALPFVVVAAALAVADVSSRDAQAGTASLIRSAPRLKENFVLWKFLSALWIEFAILAVPIVRVVATRPRSLLPLLVGVVFICAAATACGVISENPRTFMVIFLTFWYLTVNDRGRTPALDFAGFYANPAAPTLTYLALSIGLVIVTAAFYAARLRREG